jgi:glycosyltransferase involved in cell wall biosynthesis
MLEIVEVGRDGVAARADAHRLTVLNVIPGYYPSTAYGGPVFSMHYACQALARFGIRVHVATTNVDGQYGRWHDVPTDRPVEMEPNYRVHYYKGNLVGHWSNAFATGLDRDMRSADVVHLQDVYSVHAALTVAYALRRNKPVLISPRGIFSTWAMASGRSAVKKAWVKTMIRPFIANRSRVVWHATSTAERDDILRVFPQSTVHVVPNAIDCEAIANTERICRKSYIERFFPAAAVPAEGSVVIATLSRLHRIKGLDIAIDAFHKLRDRVPGALLLMAGADEGERQGLEARIERLGLNGSAVCVGPQFGESKAVFLRGADLFMFPSHSENFGLALLEALAAGLPAVASRNTPWPELDQLHSGRWVENTPDAFAEATCELLGPGLAEYAENARCHAANYSLDRLAQSFERIYREMSNAARA